MVLKCHHCFTDGLGLSAFAMALADEYDANNLPRINPPHWIYEIFLTLMFPFLVIKGLVGVPRFGQARANNIHAFKHDKTLVKGIKSGAFSMDLDISLIKIFCKKQQCTVNEYIAATFGTTISEYFETQKD
jgi:hypothetical protein